MSPGITHRPGQTRALGCAVRTDAVDHFPHSLARDLHARIAQRQEDRIALAGLPKPFRHQRVASRPVRASGSPEAISEIRRCGRVSIGQT